MALSLEPGFLDFDNLPDTNFSCVGKVIGGYYADLETNCQMFHVCTIGQLDEPMDIRFLCLNGTVFDQETRVCERIDEVDCSKSERFYSLNLELYGNTQPAILEDSPETEQPLIIKPTTTTTSTTTQKPKATNTPFYSSAKPPTITTQAVAQHHFTLGNSPDIRFNPEEINISLHPGAPPDIRTRPATYQQQSYSDNNKKVVVTTHSENSDSKKVSVTTHSEVFDDGKVLPSEELLERPQVQVPSTQKPLSHSYGHSNSHTNQNFQHPTPSDINYEFTFRQTDPNQQDYQTEIPQSYFLSDFHSSQDFTGHHHNPHNQQFKSSTFHNDFTPTTKGHYQQKIPTTVRNYFLQSLKPPAPNQPNHYSDHQLEKPQRVQLPLPLLPTLPPLTFSSPAPFSLQRHIDTKRYTKDHQSPPRIVISASASVSDASGRRLNYSLGTIGAAEILEQPPQSYDEYKDEDVGLDPFYHDVPKLKRSRIKRDATAKIKHTDIIKSEQEAVDVLKFLFDWYRNNERTATESTTAPTVTVTDHINEMKGKHMNVSTTEAVEVEITAEASEAGVNKENQTGSFKDSELFNKNSKYSIIGNDTDGETVQKQETVGATDKEQINVTTPKTTTTTKISKYEKDFLDELFGHEEDYVNDNFEPIAYNDKYKEQETKNIKKAEEVTKSLDIAKTQDLPMDYVDDNIEPIYFRDLNEKERIIEKEPNTEEGTKVPLGENAKGAVEDSSSTNTNESRVTNKQSNSFEQKPDDEVKELPTENGDIETNYIKQNIPKQENTVNEATSTVETVSPTNTSETVNFSEPKSEILESMTTEKSTTSMRHRSNPRRGRKRYYNTTEKEKEPEYKKVVLEKITERAHTAKDDFNYLRTLYKVYTTTPKYSASEIKSLEKYGTTKAQMVVNDDIDLKEASPSEKVIRTSVEENRELDEYNFTSQPQDLIPFITTESTTTIELLKPLSTSTTTTELIIPSSTTEGAMPANTTTSTTTTEMVISSRRDIRRRGRNRHGNESNRSRSDIRIHSRRRPKEIHEPSEAYNSRPDKTSILIQKSNTPDEVQTGSAHEIKSDVILGENAVSNVKHDKIQSTIASTDSNLETRNSTDISGQTNSNKEVVIEENGSNTIRSFIPYPRITTEYIPTLPNNIVLGGSTEQTEFFTQLTLNYKKIFEDITQTSQPVVPQILDATTSAITEAYGNVASSSSMLLEQYKESKSEDKLKDELVVSTDYGGSLLPTTTSSNSPVIMEEIYQTTIKPEENISTPSNNLKSENQLKEITTTDPPLGNTDSLTVKTLESLPTTLLPIEEPVKNEFVAETTSSHIPNEAFTTIEDKVVDTPITQIPTNKLFNEAKIVDIVPTTSVLTENVYAEEKSSTTERNYKKTKDVVDSVHNGKDNVLPPELTTIDFHQEISQTTSNPTRVETTSIPKITEIFNFHGISKGKNILESIPVPLFSTEHSLKSTDIYQKDFERIDGTISTQSSRVEDDPITSVYRSDSTERRMDIFKGDTLQTEEYPSTVFVVRTTEISREGSEDSMTRKQQINEEYTERTQTYPSTVLVIRTTETPKTSRSAEDEKLPGIRQLSTEGLQKLIEKIEENTKSVVATTIVPMTMTYPKSIVTTTENKEDIYESTEPVIATTERREDLEELTSLFKYSTESSYVITNPPNILLTPREEITESTNEPKVSTTTDISSILSEETSTVPSIMASDPDLMSTSQIERLTNTEKPIRTTTASAAASSERRRGNGRRRGNIGGRRRNPEARRNTVRHRFSTESFTAHPESRKQTIEEEIIDELTKNSRGATTESYRRRLRVRPKNNEIEDYSTDTPLRKSASPTRAERTKESLSTTPLSKEGNARRYFIFNCFGKEMDRFYPDPRDCRLFHYCTQGYNKNQLIDMKFVCDLNTYFDDVKLICSKRKPRRCL